jgi:hypothetical protein
MLALWKERNTRIFEGRLLLYTSLLKGLHRMHVIDEILLED